MDDLFGFDGSVSAFLRDWYGQGQVVKGRSSDPSPELPPVLREFYLLAENYPEAVTQNDLLQADEIYWEGTRLVFYVENQGVFLWSTEVTGADDERVWGRWNEPDEPWQEEPERLSRFLLQVALFEAIMGAPERASAAWLDSRSTADALSSLTRLPLEPWRWPRYPTAFFGGQGVLAVQTPNEVPGVSGQSNVIFGAQSADNLRFLEPFVDEKWEIYTPGEG